MVPGGPGPQEPHKTPECSWLGLGDPGVRCHPGAESWTQAGDPPAPGSRRNRWAEVHGQGQRRGGVRGRGRRNRQGFSKGQAARGPAPRPAHQQSRGALRAAGPALASTGSPGRRAATPGGPQRALGPGATARPAATGVFPGRSSALPRNKSRRPRWSSRRAGREWVRGALKRTEARKRGAPRGRPQTSLLSHAGVPGGSGACPMGTRARGGGERRATGKLTAVVRLIAVGVRLVLGGLGGRPRGAGAGAGARTGTVGSKELVHILVVVAAAVGGAAGAGAGCGRARGGVRGRGGAGRGGGGQAPWEAGEVVGDLFDGPNGPRAHVDGHMLLDADGRLLPAPPEGHAGSAAARGPARPGVTPALGQLSGSRGARLGLRASPAWPPDGPDSVLPAWRRLVRVSVGQAAGGGPSPRHPAATKR